MNRPEPVLDVPVDGPLDGPVWDGSALLVCRPEANEILSVDPGSGETLRFRHSTAGARGLAVSGDGRLYAAQARSRRVVWYDLVGGGAYYLNAMLDGRRQNDPQDLAVDPEGRIWLTDDWTDASSEGPVGWPPLDHRSVLRLTQIAVTEDGIGDWILERVSNDTAAPHGIAIDAVHRVVYVTDLGSAEAKAPATLRAYDLDAAQLPVEGDVLHEFGAGERPGGACVDAEGRIAVTISGHGPDGRDGSGRLLRFSRSGGLVADDPIDGVPTNVTLGGRDGRTLYLTTTDGQILRVTDAGRTAGT